MDNNNGEALTTSQSQSVADNESDASTLKNDGDDAKGHSLAGGPFAASEGHLMQRNDTEMPTEDMPEPAASSGIEGEAQNQSDIPRNTPPPEYSGEIDSNTRCQETDSSFGQGGSNKEILASATNFWLVGSYKRVVKKIEDSSKLCDELSQMMLERSEIESLYAKKLKAWNKKWYQSLSKELEYGSVLQSLLGGLAESNDIADIHLAVQGRLSKVSSDLMSWKAETYHKGIIGIKEAKRADEGFSKGQKPWAKKFDDTIKGRQSYHSACQMYEQAKTQEEDLKKTKESTTQEQLTKAQNKVKKATQDRGTALEFYKESLRDINGYNQKYKDDMVYEYEKWQTAEGKRKEFVIEKMKQLKDCIDMSQFQTRIYQIYTKMSEIYDAADTTNDLDFFRRNFGPDMPFIDLSFVEYNPEIHNAAKLKTKDQNQVTETNSSAKSKEKSKVCVAL